MEGGFLQHININYDIYMLLRIDTKEFHGASDSIVSINGHHFNKLKINTENYSRNSFIHFKLKLSEFSIRGYY